MPTWVIPYVDQGLSFWNEIAHRFGSSIREVYFPLPLRVVASGRGLQPSSFMEAFLREAKLPKAALVNPIILPQPAEMMAPQIIETLKCLCSDYGVHSVTVTNPTLGRLIRQALPDFRVAASTLMGIATPAQALAIRDDVDAITPDSRLLRDLPSLGKLRDAFDGEIRLIVNEGCLPGCVYRTQHFYEMGYGSGYPQSLCQRTLTERPWLRLTGAWVLPQHLSHYTGLYDTLKLAGRVTLRDQARYIRVLNAYVNRERLLPNEIGGGPASVFADIDMPDDMFSTILHCEKNCHACSICYDYYKQAVAARANLTHTAVNCAE